LTAQLRTLSGAQARRIALAAQGFADPRPAGRVTASHLRRVLRRVGMLQLDSVNVLVRSHYLPLFSRLGPYPLDLLHDYAYRRRRLFEYWAHAASLIPVEHYPLFRHRMASMQGWHIYEFAKKQPDYVDTVLNEVRERGPIRVGELGEPGNAEGGWWGWGPGKIALEYLFIRGLITTASRDGFTRMYDVSERVIDPIYFNARPLARDEANRALTLMAARSLGVATAKDIAWYYRLPLLDTRQILDGLEHERLLERVAVDGWKQPAYLHPDARLPRRINARALLSPFDSLIWERDRTERLFHFRYRIEIYTPAPKRIYGYYVLPFLLGENLVARVDLKSHRQTGRLLVRAAHREEGADEDAIAPALAEELRAMATWLNLPDVAIEPTGNLASALARRL
jgi:uncharacterized protein